MNEFYSQYGEEKILSQFFGDKTHGFLVDIGAMDGITYSNSRYLIQSKSWSGVLVEPHPEYFQNLQKLYNNNANITLLNCGCFNVETELDFHLYSTDTDRSNGSVSTISKDFKNHIINRHGDEYRETIKINTVTLNNIIKNHKNIDFLSIDAEGVDMEVLSSNDWTKNRPSLVCVEHSMDINILMQFMDNINYVKYTETGGNTFFIGKSE
jgi:FkbM family methyltransferase